MKKFTPLQKALVTLALSLAVLVGFSFAADAVEASWHQQFAFGSGGPFAHLRFIPSRTANATNDKAQAKISHHRHQPSLSAQQTATSSPVSEASIIGVKAAPSVVYINAYRDVPAYSLEYILDGNGLHASKTQTGTSTEQVSSGSGFFITANGYILTNKHVVSDTKAAYKVRYDDYSLVPAEVVYRDPVNDIAIVKISGSNFQTLPLGDSSGLAVGQTVVAVGNALGQVTDYATVGKITSLSKTIIADGENGASEILKNVIESNAKLYPGDSGGPLLDLQGCVVAVNTATMVGGRSGGAEGYSIPVNIAKETIAKIGIKA